LGLLCPAPAGGLLDAKLKELGGCRSPPERLRHLTAVAGRTAVRQGLTEAMVTALATGDQDVFTAARAR